MNPAILLVHGLFGSLGDAKILDAFGESTVVAPDLIGYGGNAGDAPDAWTLHDQADHLADIILRRGGGPMHVVGHSVGGAVAVLLAHRLPDALLSLTSVEGNFTLDDAFWSQRIATAERQDIAAEVDGFRADVGGWIGKAGVPATPWTLSVASRWLDHQPPSTLRNQARAVVAATGDASYLEAVSALLDRRLPVHLLAGEHTRAGWNVPDWVVARATSHRAIDGTGHLMMLQSPERFAQAIHRNLIHA